MTNQKEQGTTRQVMTSQDPTQYEKIYQMTLKIFYKIHTPIPSNQLSQSVTLFCKKIPLDTHHYSPTTKTRKLKKKKKREKSKIKKTGEQESNTRHLPQSDSSKLRIGVGDRE